jgi:hypothetical protein
VLILQPGERQFWFPPPLSVVTFTTALIVALGATDTDEVPLRVTELIMRESVKLVVAVAPDAPVAVTVYVATNQAGS